MRSELSEYIIKRDETDHRKVKPWIVLKDGTPLTHDQNARNPCVRSFPTRKAAQAEIDKDIVWDAYVVRLFEQDAAGVYEWNADENEEIEKFAQRLRENPEQWTFNGPARFVAIARRQHEKDAEDLEKDDWIDAKRFHAEKRRTRAARVEAFKRAGVEL